MTMEPEPYLQCSRCVMDNSAPNTNLSLDENGVCNNCRSYDTYVKTQVVSLSLADRQKKLDEVVEWIKRVGKGNEYDCIVGISGGVDSSYVAYRAKELGFRPLVVHFDNGWNTELAVKNIENVLKKLGFDLLTYVINWQEFKDLHLAYLKAGVVDIEVPTDHFIYATMYELAYQHGIRFILDGNNIETEFWGGSWKWAYSKVDLVNLEAIHKKYGSLKLKEYPKLGLFQRYFYTNIVGIYTIHILNYLPYNKKEVMRILQEDLDWRDPGGKHYESIFTRFYQGYILPKKFKIDKRKIHLSNLIWSGQISREDALKTLEGPTYPTSLQEQDKEYIIKKFGLTSEQFDSIMNSPPVDHESFPTEKSLKWKYDIFVWSCESKLGKLVLYLLKRVKIIKSWNF